MKNYVGTKHANITIINVYNTTVGKTAYCVCDCGNQSVCSMQDILEGKQTTCGRKNCTADKKSVCPVVLYKDVMMADKCGKTFKSRVTIDRKKLFSNKFNNQEEPLVELHMIKVINQLDTFYNKSDYQIVMCSIEETKKYIRGIFTGFGTNKLVTKSSQLVGIRIFKWVSNTNRTKYSSTGYPFKLLKEVINRINY